MQQENKRREELKKRILAAHDGLGFDIRLISDIAAYYREQRTAGYSTQELSDDLDVTTWQLVDWHQRTLGPGEEWRDGEREPTKLNNVVIEVPMDTDFWRTLVADTLRLFRGCDWCGGHSEVCRSNSARTSHAAEVEERK